MKCLNPMYSARTSYNKGCRCERCVSFTSSRVKASQQKRAAQLSEDEKELNRQKSKQRRRKYRTKVQAEQFLCKLNNERLSKQLEKLPLTSTELAKLIDDAVICPICCRNMNKSHENRGRRPVIDHCHESLNIRGIICGNCNKGLGLFEDDTEALQQAINYLRLG